MKLTRNDAQEVLHKLSILASEPDLQDDYELTQEQANALIALVPRNGGAGLTQIKFIASSNTQQR